MTTTSTSTATTTTTSKTNNVDKGTTSDNGDLPVHCKPKVNPFLDKPFLVNAFWIYFPANKTNRINFMSNIAILEGITPPFTGSKDKLVTTFVVETYNKLTPRGEQAGEG